MFEILWTLEMSAIVIVSAGNTEMIYKK